MRVFLHTATLFLGLTAAMFAVVMLHLSMGSRVVDMLLSEQQQQNPLSADFRERRAPRQVHHHKPRLRSGVYGSLDEGKEHVRVHHVATNNHIVTASNYWASKREYHSSMDKTRTNAAENKENVVRDVAKAKATSAEDNHHFLWPWEYLSLLLIGAGDLEMF